MSLRDRRFWGYVAFLVVLHFILHVGVGFGAVAPDLLTVAVLLGARRLSGAQAAALGVFLGLIEDGFAVAAFGVSPFALAVIAYLGARLREIFDTESAIFSAVYFFVGKWIRDAIVFLLVPELGRGETTLRLLVEAPIAAAWAALACTIALAAYRSRPRVRR
jgi:rod shape-determining protein MreD